MSQALIRQGGAPLFQEVQSIGKAFAASGYFTDAKSEAQAIVKIMAGAEMGFSPFASMSGIHIIQGKPTVSAQLMAAKIKGSQKYDFRVAKGHPTEKECTITFFEKIDGKWEEIGVSTFTREDAQKAGTQNLNKFARNMLYARALSNGCKWYCPDVFSSPIYTPEEMGAPVDGEGNIINVTPAAVQPIRQVETVSEVISFDPEREEVLAAMRAIYEENGSAGWEVYESKSLAHKDTAALRTMLAKWQAVALAKQQAADPLAAKREEADDLLNRLSDAGLTPAEIQKLQKGAVIEDADDKELAALIVRLKSAFNELAEAKAA